VTIRDVTLRDGLQLTGRSLPTEVKVSVIRELIGLGMTELEIGSMARPDLVPTLADTVEVIGALTAAELSRCWVWVATPSQARRALAAGARNLQFCLSASSAHNLANLARSIDVSLDGLADVVGAAANAGGAVQLCVATAFSCPFAGDMPPEAALSIVMDRRSEGTVEVVLCDTTGQAHPSQVADLVSRVLDVARGREVAFHGHDTWGMGVANSMAAIGAGASSVDGALAGLGGCPFAPGASGNTATEDLAFALRPGWANPGSLARLVAIARQVLDHTDEANRSRTAEGFERSGPQFSWSARAR
jgi:hydroxymethylglutaryl-CoA lyase